MNCLLDMDGVLVNFVQGTLDLHGIKKTPEEVFNDHKGEFHLSKILKMPQEVFYKDMGQDFWSSLKWLPDGRKVLSLCESTFSKENIYLCTAPIRTIGCLEGKRLWVRENMPEYESRLIITSEKHLINGVLIDDADKNIDKFPGKSILLPRLWNSRHAENTLEVLKYELAGFFGSFII
jgi:5'(3')-deoxyribonucleotidase